MMNELNDYFLFFMRRSACKSERFFCSVLVKIIFFCSNLPTFRECHSICTPVLICLALLHNAHLSFLCFFLMSIFVDTIAKKGFLYTITNY